MANLAEVWSYWLGRAAIFGLLLFIVITQTELQPSLRYYDRAELGNQRTDPLKHAIRHYTVIGRALPVDLGDKRFAADPQFLPIWSPDRPEEAVTGLYRELGKLTSPGVPMDVFENARSAEHLEHLMQVAAKLRFDDVGFARRKNARFFIHVATAVESIAGGLLLGLLPLGQRRQRDGVPQGPVTKVPSEPPREPIV